LKFLKKGGVEMIKQPCIFLDRDGVINFERGEHTYLTDDFIINTGLFEGLKKLKQKGFIFIIITNQSGIALAKYTANEMNACHRILIDEADKHHVKFEAIYFCPHHPSVSKCLCRKPDSLLLEKAIAKFNIDVETSWFIGDKQRDSDAAHKVGVKSILMSSNQNINEVLHLIL
jgi:D-glycero-D-manno-heptose 1,7-bisphosphate phosphatase